MSEDPRAAPPPPAPAGHSQVALVMIILLVLVVVLTDGLWGDDTAISRARARPQPPCHQGTWGPRRTLILVARHTVGFGERARGKLSQLRRDLSSAQPQPSEPRPHTYPHLSPAGKMACGGAVGTSWESKARGHAGVGLWGKRACNWERDPQPTEVGSKEGNSEGRMLLTG